MRCGLWWWGWLWDGWGLLVGADVDRSVGVFFFSCVPSSIYGLGFGFLLEMNSEVNK